MSARKRRIKRKIAMLVRMDDTRSRMFSSTLVSVLTGRPVPATVFWNCAMMPLAQKITRLGAGGKALIKLNERRQHRLSTGGRE